MQQEYSIATHCTYFK